MKLSAGRSEVISCSEDARTLVLYLDGEEVRRTRAFVVEPLTSLERLVAIMPHPREHQLTYHGTLTAAHDRADHPAPLATRKVPSHLGLRTEPLELSLALPPTQTRFA